MSKSYSEYFIFIVHIVFLDTKDRKIDRKITLLGVSLQTYVTLCQRGFTVEMVITNSMLLVFALTSGRGRDVTWIWESFKRSLGIYCSSELPHCVNTQLSVYDVFLESAYDTMFKEEESIQKAIRHFLQFCLSIW